MDSLRCNCCSRRNFLKKSGQAFLALCSVGLLNPLLTSCTTHQESQSDTVIESNEETISYDSSTNTITINTGSDEGNALTSENELLVMNQIDSTTVNVMAINIGGTVRAFSAVCPHAGTTNQWSYTSSNSSPFKCGDHNNSFTTSTLNSEYQVSESGSTVTISLSSTV